MGPPPVPLAAGWTFTPSEPGQLVRVAVGAEQWAVATALARRGAYPPGDTAFLTMQLLACCGFKRDAEGGTRLGDTVELSERAAGRGR